MLRNHSSEILLIQPEDKTGNVSIYRKEPVLHLLLAEVKLPNLNLSKKYADLGTTEMSDFEGPCNIKDKKTKQNPS